MRTRFSLRDFFRATSFMALIIIFVLLVFVFIFNQHRDIPNVRRAVIVVNKMAAGETISIGLVADLHYGNYSMDSGRLRQIVSQIRTLHPDILIIAGDFVDGYGASRVCREAGAVAHALAQLESTFPIVAVLGNHDGHKDGCVGRQLHDAHITVLENDVVVRGPLIIAGLGDPATHQDNIAALEAKLFGQSGVLIWVAHSPEVVWRLPQDSAPLFAGHKHCGQIRLPLLDAINPATWTPVNCGMHDRRGHTVITTAGLGTSDVAIRLNAPPDIWMITMAGRPVSLR